MSVNERQDRKDENAPARAKRPYTAPRLTEYGSVAKLTQGTRTNQQDGPSGTSWRFRCL